MEIGLDFWLQLIVLLACLFYAAPKGGMTLGLMGGIGLVAYSACTDPPLPAGGRRPDAVLAGYPPDPL